MNVVLSVINGKYGCLAPGLLFSRLFKTLSVYIVYIDTIWKSKLSLRKDLRLWQFHSGVIFITHESLFNSEKLW